jgi:hypothetical protein
LCFDNLGESQACATAAKERIEVLEQEGEAATAEHETAIQQAAQELQAAQDKASKQLEAVQADAAVQLQLAQERQEADISRVQAELEAIKVWLQALRCTSS